MADSEHGVILRRFPNGSASWVGVQTCGSTWACPMCSERIQSARQADVAEALASARALGLVVAFQTFTVRHRRSHSLAEVWDGVADAWRASTSGSPRDWNADRDRFGVVGYLRLWEATHGVNGWHVHAHALVFLDPAGRLVQQREKIPTVPADFVGPLLPHQQRLGWKPERVAPFFSDGSRRRRVAWVDPAGVTVLRKPEGPVMERRLVPDTRAYTLAPDPTPVRVPSSRAVENMAADAHGLLAAVRAGRVDLESGADRVRLGLYLRDAQDLTRSMFSRWSASLPHGMTPSETHGWDVRLVTDDDVLASYFTKSAYSLKSTGSAAHDVVASYGKAAKRGNRTPFGILADLVERRSPVDAALWREWETVSRGRRQLRWSDGMRAMLGLAAEASDSDLVDDVDPHGDAVDLFALDARGYRSLAVAGVLAWCLDLAEDWSVDLVEQVLDAHGVAHLGDEGHTLARQRSTGRPA